MARVTVTTFTVTDSLTGEVLPEETEQTTISVNGVAVRLDLGEASLTRLNKALKPFFDKGEPVEVSTRKSAPAGPNPHLTGKAVHADNDEIREWGRNNGFQVSERGRLSNDLYKAFDAYANDPANADKVDA